MMTFKRILGAVVLAAALGAVGVGAADAAGKPADPSPPPVWAGERATIPTMSPADCDKRFTRYDGNRDGKLTYQEFAQGQFGQLRFIHAPSEREVKGFIAQYTASARNADANRDGWLTRREHLATCNHDLP